MAPDATASGVPVDEVMAAVDTGTFVIADICRDGAWLSVSVDQAADLEAWS